MAKVKTKSKWQIGYDDVNNVDTLEGRKEIGKRNKQEEACRGLAVPKSGS